MIPMSSPYKEFSLSAQETDSSLRSPMAFGGAQVSSGWLSLNGAARH